MGGEIMNTALLRRQIVYRLVHLGWPGALGALLLLAAAAYGLLVARPASDEIGRFDRRIAETQAKLLSLADAGQGALTPAQQLAVFYREFPRGATVPDVLGKIYGVAAEQKLNLDIGEYTMSRAQGGRLDRFRITFPIKGSYPQIRKFVGAAMSTAPALSMESIDIKRDKVGDGIVEARVVFMLYLEKGA
jgi:hypothetical protein